MEINYLAILACAAFSMVLGMIWYGPLFGKLWMEIVGVNPNDKKAREKMQKSAGPLYGIQLLLVIFQVWVLAYFIKGWTDVSGVVNALWIWAAFIMPTIAGTVMWNNNSKKIKISQFLIQAGYQFVLFVAFGFILGTW